MAQLFVAPIYGINANSYGTAQGRGIAFPSQGVVVRPVVLDDSFDGTFNGVTVNSVIQLLPSGLSLSQPQYYSNKTVSEIATLANA
jgi:hypothetical protein